MKHRVFAVLSLHAKMHRQLAAMDERGQLLQDIEAQEIRSYDNDAEFQRLEEMKKELLAIRFV